MYEISFYQNMLTIAILIVSYLIVFLVGSKSKKDTLIVTTLFFWHTMFSIAYFWYTLSNSADARKYYRISLGNNFDFYPGSPFIYYITSFVSKGFYASYLNATLLFNLFGALGLVLLYKSLKDYLTALPWYWVFILFIPSMSFWSGGLGKDAISFFSVCLFIYTITTNRKKVFLLPLSFFAMFMVRPHVASMIAMSYVIYFILQSKIHIAIKLIILPLIAAAFIMSMGFVQQYVGLEDASLDSISGYVDGRQSVNQGGGSSLNIASMSYPMQMFTYIFRPLPFEAHSAVALITSIENTILLFVFLYIAFKSKSSLKIFIKNENLWLFMYAFLTCTMLALTTANLGIASRQKWMFMPVLIYLLIYAFHDYKTKNNKAHL